MAGAEGIEPSARGFGELSHCREDYLNFFPTGVEVNCTIA